VDGAEDDEQSDATSLSDIEQAEVRQSLADRSITIAFVGGNETQERHRAAIEADLEQRFSGRVVISWHSGWGSNWEATCKRVDGELSKDAEVLVLMPFVRTGLGAGLRKAAGASGRPWIACSGNGRQWMQQAIEQALVCCHPRSSLRPRFRPCTSRWPEMLGNGLDLRSLESENPAAAGRQARQRHDVGAHRTRHWSAAGILHRYRARRFSTAAHAMHISASRHARTALRRECPRADHADDRRTTRLSARPPERSSLPADA
jgi:hypothetical protein